MNIIYRNGTPEDLSEIIRFLDDRSYFSGYIGFEKPEVVRPFIVKSYRDNLEIFKKPDDFPIFIAQEPDSSKIIGYMFLINGVVETITDDKQTVIYDFCVRDCPQKTEIMDRFLAQTGEVVRKFGYDYVTTEIRPEEIEKESYFASRGFHIEMNRIVKQVGKYTFEGPRHERFLVRPAVEEDRMFILLLNAENSTFLIPSGRESKTDEIRALYFGTYAVMDFEENPTMKVLIAEDRLKHRSAGYIMLKMESVDIVTGRLLAYLYDISIQKDYWGTVVSQRLTKEAENWLSERNIQYLIGDTSESNPRPLITALKTLRFKLFSRRWVRAAGDF
jgi:hypothetical protein